MSSKLVFFVSEGPLDSLWVELLSAVFFTVGIWGPLVVTSGPVFWMTDPAILTSQIRFILRVFPSLAQGWPGPFNGVLMPEHRLLLGMVDGGFGAFIGWLISRTHDHWLMRVIWVAFSWMIWVSIMTVFLQALSMGYKAL